jgi:hypothetical protein
VHEGRERYLAMSIFDMATCETVEVHNLVLVSLYISSVCFALSSLATFFFAVIQCDGLVTVLLMSRL